MTTSSSGRPHRRFWRLKGGGKGKPKRVDKKGGGDRNEFYERRWQLHC